MKVSLREVGVDKTLVHEDVSEMSLLDPHYIALVRSNKEGATFTHYLLKTSITQMVVEEDTPKVKKEEWSHRSITKRWDRPREEPTWDPARGELGGIDDSKAV